MPWAPYGDTILRFPGAGFELDLRRAVGENDRKELRRLGLSGGFAVVTACNPLGRVLDPASNRRLAAQLAAVVRRDAPSAVPADGVSPGGDHVEPGWALPGPLEPALRLAARFFQRAVFWYDGHHVHIVPVLAAEPRVRLPDPGGQSVTPPRR